MDITNNAINPRLNNQTDESITTEQQINNDSYISTKTMNTNIYDDPIQEFLSQQKQDFINKNVITEQNKTNELISIGTHNVRGINNKVDQNNIIEELEARNIDILGICETKLTANNENFAFENSPNYKCFSSTRPTQTYGSGVAIIIKKNLAKHIGHITKIEGHIIALHMFFKKSKFCIIQIYLPSNKKLSTKYQQIIRKIITNEINNKSKIILMGDFNAVENPQTDRLSRTTPTNRLSWRPEIEIFNFLNDWAFTDIQKAWEKEQLSHTWHNRFSSSRIDYIWLSTDIATNNVHSFENNKAESLTNSDHTLLNVKLFEKNIFNLRKYAPTKKKKKKKINILDSKNATKEQWIDFQEKVDKNLNKSDINILIKKLQQVKISTNGNTQPDNEEPKKIENNLEEIWVAFENSLIKAAKKSLPQKKITISDNTQNKQNKTTPEFKKYRKAFKMLDALNKAERSKNQMELDILIKSIDKFNKNNPELIIKENNYTNLNTIQWSELKKEIKEVILALREECYRIENMEKKKSIDKAITQRCQDYQDNQRKMINSLTNTHKKSIKIDRIMVTTNETKYIETRPKEINKKVEEYYTKAFTRRKTDFNRLGKDWKKQYEPRNYIDQEWFNDILLPPSLQELEETIKDLPLNKASGPSQITYEMLKHLSTEGKKKLNNIFHCCILIGSIPKSWKSSTIYPIPKNKEWEADLANTRPIMLMETTRKCFTKIITNRLSKIIKERNILRGPNFAGLPGESTAEPIQLLNNICEEAREQNKELWILLQDTAKAFDTVNLEMLEKALQRIKILRKLIKLIIFLFKERKFRVITDNGLTNIITAGDGIDQGETISPLLWRIFYDPLLCKIQENKELGYKMKCTWRPNLQTSEEKSLQSRNATIAFMDDTNWIANSKDNLQRILNEAREFYKANDSQINSSKSVLLVINGQDKDVKSVQAGLNKETVNMLDNKEFTRFLGVWIGNKDHKKETIARIKQEIDIIVSVLKQKKATDKQTLYILNRILIPRIEYRLQHCHLSSKECDILTAKYRRTLKNKIKICNTIPNSAVHHKGLLNLKSIWEIQTESQITNLTILLNDTGMAGISSLIRLKQSQINNWEPSNIITDKIPNTFKCQRNFTAKVLKAANKMNIRFKNSTIEDLFQWEGGKFSIQNVITDDKIYKKSINSLKKKQLMFIDQLIDTDLKILLSWNFIKMLRKTSRKGPEPGWFKKIRTTITDNGIKLKQEWVNLPWTANQILIDGEITEDKRRKEWCCHLDNNNNVVWGKILDKKNNKKILVRHYLCENKEKETTTITQCQGCNNKNSQIKDELCTINISKKKLIGCGYINNNNVCNSGNAKLPCNTFTLEKAIKDELNRKGKGNNDALIPINVIINPWEIEDINKLISSENHRQELIELYIANKNKQSLQPQDPYEFYTDGSLFNRGQQEITMGAAWIQTKGPNPGSYYTTGVENWPSSTRAEATAIATALLTVPINSKVTIYTDSQACIETYNRLSKSSPKQTYKRWLKEKNWSIWSIIIDTIKKRNINSILNKVKAHTGNTNNEKADQLAKQATQQEAIHWNGAATYKVKTSPEWQGIIIDIPIRSFLKEINSKRLMNEWINQKRIQKTFKEQIHNQDNYTWRPLWNNIRIGGPSTSFKDKRKRSFWLKLIHNELPTLDRQAIRRPDLYGQDKICPLCRKEEETKEHIFNCKELESQTTQAWKKTTKRILKDIKKISSTKEKEKLDPFKPADNSINEHIENFIESLKQSIFESDQKLFNFTVGLVEQKFIKELEKLLNKFQTKRRTTTSKAREIMIAASNKFRNNFRRLVWNHRCNIRAEIDKTIGINKKMKRERPTGKKKEKEKENNSRLDDKENRDAQTSLQTLELSNTTEVTKRLYDWIKGGIKWLGL